MMGHPPFVPELERQLEVADLHREVLRKLIDARNRIKATKPSVELVTCVKYFNESYRDIAVWVVTPWYAIDDAGNLLTRWAVGDPHWPGVKYEMLLVPSVGYKGLRELHDHLDTLHPLFV